MEIINKNYKGNEFVMNWMYQMSDFLHNKVKKKYHKLWHKDWCKSIPEKNIYGSDGINWII